MRQDLRPNAVITQVRSKAEFLVRLHRIASSVLQGIGPDFVCQANATALLVQIEQDSRPFFSTQPQRLLQLLPTVTAKRADHTPTDTPRLHPCPSPPFPTTPPP